MNADGWDGRDGWDELFARAARIGDEAEGEGVDEPKVRAALAACRNER